MSTEIHFCPSMPQHVVFCLVTHDQSNKNLEQPTDRHLWQWIDALLHFYVAFDMWFMKLQFVTFLQLLGKASQDSLRSGRYPAASQTQKLQAADATVSDLPLTEIQNSTSAPG